MATTKFIRQNRLSERIGDRSSDVDSEVHVGSHVTNYRYQSGVLKTNPVFIPVSAALVIGLWHANSRNEDEQVHRNNDHAVARFGFGLPDLFAIAALAIVSPLKFDAGCDFRFNMAD